MDEKKEQEFSIADVPVYDPLISNVWSKIVYNYPPKGRRIVVAYTETHSVEVYIVRYEKTLRGIVVLVFTKSVG